jgi:SAM-dependent methyltransferase
MGRIRARLTPDLGSRNEQARDSWVRRELAAIPDGWRILDAGAGEQPYRTACSHLAYVSQDFAQYRGVGDIGLQPGAWDASAVDIVSDITAIPVPDASFDAALCTEVLEHVPDPIAVVRELARIVRPGGTLVLTAPFASLTHQAPFHFSTGFGPAWYEYHLPAAGFEIVQMTPNGDYFAYVAQEIGRTPDVGRRYAPGAVIRRRDRGSLLTTLRVLDRLASVDQRSAELLCFGWHVRARRIDGADAGG